MICYDLNDIMSLNYENIGIRYFYLTYVRIFIK